MSDEPKDQPKSSLLGVPTEEIANLSVDDIVNNKPAITMVFHYYKVLSDENTSLKNDLNTLSTYVSAYEKKKSNSATATILLGLSNILVGFGINILTNNNFITGLVVFIPGICLAIAGFCIQFFKDKAE